MRLKKNALVLLLLVCVLPVASCNRPGNKMPTPVETATGALTEPATATAKTTVLPTVPKADLVDASESVTSPDGRLVVSFTLEQGKPYYQVKRNGEMVVKPSKLGVTLKDLDPLNNYFTVKSVARDAFDQTWSQPWGEVQWIRNHYNELRLELEETTPNPRRMALVFRVYNDGLGFRYEWPQQEHLAAFEIMNEQTEFALASDGRAWWIPAFWDNRYEYLYEESLLSKIASNIGVSAVHTPLTIESQDGLYISIHEAALVDYASMTLTAGRAPTLKAELVPWSDGVKVRAVTPHVSPWRTIQITENPGDLITSYLILNLNEPNKLADTSWIVPAKYIGIWWGMHLGKYTWGSGPQHGATTENAKAYIDFAAEHDFSGVLIEGWNLGWDGNWIANGELFSFTEPYPDFDLEAVAAYAAEKGVKVIGHHETAAAIANYEAQIEDGFTLYRRLGVDTVKTGYVGYGKGIKRYDRDGYIRGLEWHHGQFMVQHYQFVTDLAAQYGIMLNIHEPIKDTGLRRTYPNLLTREGARGQEYNAWSADGGNPPEHTTILPFTRMLAGPMDFTPGIFDLLFNDSKPENRINTTLAKQLALYVVIYSPLQMAADLPENYRDEAVQAAFQFIKEVPVDWQDTKVLHAQIGDFVTIVRKDRNSREWYMGSITDEQGRTLEAPLTFLEPEQRYVAEVYADGPDAGWQSNPLSIAIDRFLVDNQTVLALVLAPGGGAAIRFRPATAQEINNIPPYRP